jgi:hypothetical protein
MPNAKKGEAPEELDLTNDTSAEDGADVNTPVVVETAAPNKGALTVKTAGVQKVKIRCLIARKSTIAGVVYDLEKDRNYDVPPDVAAILINGRVAVKL